jgi:putative SOS response-associated peptidase YedK
MCGRFTLTAPGDVLAEVFELEQPPPVEARYNIAPTQPVLAIPSVAPDEPRRALALRWGLAPGPGRAKRPLINARSEGIATRPELREAFASRRCLIPADGFFEWSGAKGAREAYYVRRRDGRPFAFAGLWEPTPGAELPGACVILTTAPNALVRGIHDRMPVIVPGEAQASWLDIELRDPRLLRAVFAPIAPDELQAQRVGTAVNNSRVDSPGCIVPV